VASASSASGRKPRAKRKARDRFLPECTEHETAAVEMMLRCRSGPIRLGSSACDGRGVFAAGAFHKGDFVCEYKGVLLTGDEMVTREAAYGRRHWGSFIMTFQDDRHWHAIDATAERPEYGLARYINHSARRGNLRLCCIVIGGIPRVAMLAKREIRDGEELLFDYGDREQSVLKNNPWLQH
jgi:histone-lysine N-methyltransferase SETD8